MINPGFLLKLSKLVISSLIGLLEDLILLMFLSDFTFRQIVSYLQELFPSSPGVYDDGMYRWWYGHASPPPAYPSSNQAVLLSSGSFYLQEWFPSSAPWTSILLVFGQFQYYMKDLGNMCAGILSMCNK